MEKLTIEMVKEYMSMMADACAVNDDWTITRKIKEFEDEIQTILSDCHFSNIEKSHLRQTANDLIREFIC